jgi:hypothetical protein
MIPQEAKYVERWTSTTSDWAGWSGFYIPVDRYGGAHSLLICTSSPLVFPTCHQASQQENTNEQNIKKRTGPALWLLCGDPNQVVPFVLYTVLLYTHTSSVISASRTIFHPRK